MSVPDRVLIIVVIVFIVIFFLVGLFKVSTDIETKQNDVLLLCDQRTGIEYIIIPGTGIFPRIQNDSAYKCNIQGEENETFSVIQL